MPNKRVGWKNCKSSRVEKVRVGWGKKSKNANRVGSFIWHLRVVCIGTTGFEKPTTALDSNIFFLVKIRQNTRRYVMTS